MGGVMVRCNYVEQAHAHFDFMSERGYTFRNCFSMSYTVRTLSEGRRLKSAISKRSIEARRSAVGGKKLLARRIDTTFALPHSSIIHRPQRRDYRCRCSCAQPNLKFSPLIIISISDFFQIKQGWHSLVQFISALSVPLEFPFVSFDLMKCFMIIKAKRGEEGSFENENASEHF